MTVNGIETNLIESPYKFTNKNLTFFFSSKFYLNKFVTNYQKFVEIESQKSKIKYQNNINFEIYYLLSFYKRIEKRGFYVEHEGKAIPYNIEFKAVI